MQTENTGFWGGQRFLEEKSVSKCCQSSIAQGLIGKECCARSDLFRVNLAKHSRYRCAKIQAMASMLVMVLVVIDSSPGLAATSCTNWGPSTITIEGAEISSCVLNTNGVLAVTNTGSIITVYYPAVQIPVGVSASSITNSGTISGRGFSSGGFSTQAITVTGSSLVGGITNSGTISSFYRDSILIQNGSIVGGIINSGTISGFHSIHVDVTSRLSSINITGTTAHLVGDVVAPNTPLNIMSGADFTSQNTFDVNRFNIDNTGVFNMANGVTVANGFINAGTLSVTEGVIANITGNYSQADTGTFKTGASSNVNFGKLVVSGTAALPAAAKIDVNVNGVNTLANGQTLTGVINAGTLTVTTFARVTDNSGLFDFSVVKNGNAIDLIIAPAGSTGGPSVVSSVNSTGRTAATGVAVVWDTLVTGAQGGDMGSVIATLGGLSSQQQISDAVLQTLPLLAGGQSIAVRNALRGTNRIIHARQESARGRSAGDEFYGDKYLWMKPFGNWVNQDGRNGVSGYNVGTYGMIFGADDDFSDTNRLGLAFVYSRSNIDGNSSIAPQSSNVDSYQAVIYGGHNLSEVTDFNYQLDIGRHSTIGNRSIFFMSRTAHADYNSWSGHVGAGLARTFKFSDATSVTPSIRADYMIFRDGSYFETGAGALNLNVNNNTLHEIILGVDGKLAHALNDKISLTANLGGGYDVLNQQASISAAFAGSPTASFITKGLVLSPWMARGGLGLVGRLNEAIELSARYDFEVRDGFDNQTASLIVRGAF